MRCWLCGKCYCRTWHEAVAEFAGREPDFAVCSMPRFGIRFAKIERSFGQRQDRGRNRGRAGWSARRMPLLPNPEVGDCFMARHRKAVPRGADAGCVGEGFCGRAATRSRSRDTSRAP